MNCHECPNKLKSIETTPVHHECALVGIIFEEPTKQINSLTEIALSALQHRGQEAAGVARVTNGKIIVNTNLGLLSQALPEEFFANLPETHAMIGHTRYSTAGNPELKNAQPYLFESQGTEFAVAHNGNVVWDKKPENGEPTSDSYGIGKAIAEGKGTFEENVINVISKLNGAFVLMFLTKDAIYVARDPWGFRPCVIGQLNAGVRGMTVASETVALDKMGAKYMGDVPPGTLVKITNSGVEELWTDLRVKEFKPSACSFEKTYFADSTSLATDVMGYENTTNHEIREMLGERLAAKYKPIGDYIVPIPFSGFSFATGVARYYENNPAPDITKNIHHHRQIQLEYAVQANRYAGRTFIAPETPQGRMLKASLKYNFIPKYIKDKNLILVDDSIVRGATMQGLILNLFRLGAKNITLLIGVPPIKNPCYWGIDFANPKELIFNQLNWADDSSFEEQLALWLTGGDMELAKYLRVHFQTQEDYVSIVQNVPYGTALCESGGCFHCVGGPTPEGALVNEEMQKNRFEEPVK